MKPALNLTLKMAMLASGKKQKRIAALARMTDCELSLIVRGHRRPTPKQRERLANVLGRASGDLFPTVLGAA